MKEGASHVGAWDTLFIYCHSHQLSHFVIRKPNTVFIFIYYVFTIVVSSKNRIVIINIVKINTLIILKFIVIANTFSKTFYLY